MRPGRSILTALAAALAAGPATASAATTSAPDTLTPEGPATLRQTWLGARPAIAPVPGVIVGWSVRVGAGGRGGPVALRVLGEAAGPASSRVDLPATPGLHSFPARLPVEAYEVALDQETGGHAILHTHPHTGEPGDTTANPHAVDIWRPPLAAGERREPAERLSDRELLVDVKWERDIDEDGYGDATQDTTDLHLGATARRRGRIVRARVVLRNRGERLVAHPQVTVALRSRDRLRGLRATGCGTSVAFTRATPEPGRCALISPVDQPAHRIIGLPAIAPGRARVVTFAILPGTGTRRRIKLTAAAEGRDPTPARATLRTRR